MLFNSRFKCKGALSKAIQAVEQFFALFQYGGLRRLQRELLRVFDRWIISYATTMAGCSPVPTHFIAKISGLLAKYPFLTTRF